MINFLNSFIIIFSLIINQLINQMQRNIVFDTKLQVSLSVLEKMNQQLKLKNQGLNKQIVQLNKQVNTLKSKEQQSRYLIANLEQQKLDNLKVNKELNLKINQLRDKLDLKNYQIQSLKKLQAQIEVLNEQVSQLKEQKQEHKTKLREKQYEWQTLNQKYQKLMQKQQQIKLKAIFPSSKSVKIYLETSNKNFLAYKIKIYQINPNTGQNRQLEYQNNQIIIDKLSPSTQYRFEVLLKTMTNYLSKYISNPLFYFKTNSPQQIFMPLDMKSQEEKHNYVSKQLESLKNTLVLDTYFPELKITLFGSMGQGKSSLLNTFNSIIKGRYDPISMTGNSNKSITKQARKIRDILSTEVPLSIIDIFGLEETNKMDKERALNPLQQSNYKQIFDYFFDGSLYETYQVDQKLDREKLVQSSDGIDRLSRQIHAVIYVISYRMLQNKNQIARTKYILKLLQQRDINPVIALTKCDQLINAPISELESNQKSKNIIEQVLKNLSQVKRQDIFIIANYISNFRNRDFIKEYFVLNMFQEVIIRAKKRLQWKLEKFFWLQKQDKQSYYGVIQQVGLQNYGSRIEQVLRKSFENRNIPIDRLMFLKSQYSGGQKLQKWVTAAEFFKSPLLDFIFESQKRKIIKIKESNTALLGCQTTLLKIPIYDPVLNKKLGIINLGNMTIEQCENFYEVGNLKQFCILKNNQKVNDKSTKLSEVVKQNYLPVKIHIKILNEQQEKSYFTINFYHKQKRVSYKMLKTKGIKTKQFYDWIRKKHPKILQQYYLLYLDNADEILPQDDTPLQQCVKIEKDVITVCMQKK